MSHSTTTEPKDTLNEQNTAKEQNNNHFGKFEKQLIVRDSYKGLQIVGMGTEETPEIKKWFGALGNQRITDYFETETDIKKYIDEKPFEIIVVLTAVVIEKLEEQNK